MTQISNHLSGTSQLGYADRRTVENEAPAKGFKSLFLNLQGLMSANSDGPPVLTLQGEAHAFDETGPLVVRDVEVPSRPATVSPSAQPKTVDGLDVENEGAEDDLKPLELDRDLARNAPRSVTEAVKAFAASGTEDFVSQRASVRAGKVTPLLQLELSSPAQPFSSAPDGDPDIPDVESLKTLLLRADYGDVLGEGSSSDLSLTLLRGEGGWIIQVTVPEMGARQRKHLEQRLIALARSHGHAVNRVEFLRPKLSFAQNLYNREGEVSWKK